MSQTARVDDGENDSYPCSAQWFHTREKSQLFILELRQTKQSEEFNPLFCYTEFLQTFGHFCMSVKLCMMVITIMLQLSTFSQSPRLSILIDAIISECYVFCIDPHMQRQAFS